MVHNRGPGNSLLSSDPRGSYVGKQATTHKLFILKNYFKTEGRSLLFNPSTEAAGSGASLVFEGYGEGGEGETLSQRIK